MAKRLDHRMMLRLCFAMVLAVGVTGLVKSYALRKDASGTTPVLAYRYILNVKSSLENLPPRDGWGNPFFWMSRQRLLVSAGLDERFHTLDDLIFVWLGADCSASMRQWFRSGINDADLRPETLPDSLRWNSNHFRVEGPGGSCSIPDLSGLDGLYGTQDDLFTRVVVLIEGKPPKRKKKKLTTKNTKG